MRIHVYVERTVARDHLIDIFLFFVKPVYVLIIKSDLQFKSAPVYLFTVSSI